MNNDRYDGRNGYNGPDRHGSTSGRQNMSKEQNAREEAYREYLKLRESRGARREYIRDDNLYGEYIQKDSATKHRSGSDSTREEQDRQRYMELRESERRKAEEQRSRPSFAGRHRIAEQGRRNKADEDLYSSSHPRNGKAGVSKTKKRKKGSRSLKVALIATLVLVLGIGGIIAAGLTVVKSTLDNVGRVELDPDMIGINPQVDSDLRNYRNIALLGIDARDMSDDSGTRSDAVIIVSINKETNDIKMFSVYRDTLLDLGDDVGLDKITHAYYYGGPTKTLYTLNKNLDLNIKEVVIVNWKAVADTVDALGGLDIEIQDSEINEMNKYIQDTYNNIGGSDKKIESAGMQTLNGNQAVTYARIRKDALTGDYRRNERMKIVVQAAFKKAKSMDVGTIKSISSDILPQIKTNMSSGDMMKLALKLNSFDLSSKNVGWPYETRGWTGAAWYGPPVTLYSNVSKLHEDFFGQKEYVPTQDVQSISESISATTGYY